MEITTKCTTQSYINIICSNLEEAEKLKKTLLTPPFRFFNNLCRWGNWNYAEIISLMPKILKSKNINEKLQLTDREIKFINEILDK